MGKIVLLDELTANKIAAGEVVERPASVIKELIENSIDAGSSKIEISITDGGLTEIILLDNGAGMDAEDALLAFERHATSKIKSAQDLIKIMTLGFRGEALASIAAVSRLTLKTKTQASVAGTKIVIEGGIIRETTETGCPEGTFFTVSDIFYNTPARKKHLKSSTYEAGQISDVVNKFALGYPRISFQLKSNNRIILKTSGNGNLLECIAGIFGSEFAKEMLLLENSSRSFQLNGYIGKPSLSRAARSHEIIYINGRSVKNRVISEAVEKAYHSMLMTGRHPVFVLNIQTDPELVDVNVHPAKTEVRIAEPELLSHFITQSVSAVLSGSRLIPVTNINWTRITVPKVEIKQEELKLRRPSDSKPLSINGPDTSETLKSDSGSMDKICESTTDYSGQNPVFISPSEALLQDAQQDEDGFPELRPIGQIDSTYIIAQGPDGMFLIDQHAAHERILYEKFMSSPELFTVSEQLLFPEMLQLTHQEAQNLTDMINVFTDLGFVVQHFGGDSFLLRSVPVQITQTEGKEIFLDLLDYFSVNRCKISGKNIKEKLLITMACKSAIKAHHKLGLPEMETLLAQLAAARQPYTCPHGRPTIIHFSSYDLEKKFKRVL